MPISSHDDNKSKAELIAEVQKLRAALQTGKQAAGVMSHDLATAHEAEQRFRLMTEMKTYGVWMASPDGALMYASQTFLDLLGIPMEQAVGYGWMSRLHPDDAGKVKQEWQHCIQAGERWDIEFRALGPNSQQRTILVRGGPALNKDGKITCWVGMNLDITERKHDETQVAEARDRAEQKNVAKDQFLAMLSHELRTPLTPVAMAVAALAMDPSLPKSVRDDMAMIRRNLDMEVRLIDDLLDLSRFTSGKITLRLGPVNVQDEMHHAVDTVRSELADKQLHLEWDLQAKQFWVSGDAARIRQVFWNLIRNACKFTPAGGRITVRSCNDAAGHLQMQVSDTGIGIKAEALKRIFTPFEQGEERIRQTFGGLGLGLAISKGIVDVHHGKITAQSEGEDRGATFMVELPTITNPAQLESPEEPLEPGRLSLSILLVEDHEDTARLLMRLLRGSGYDMAHAHNGLQALQLAGQREFDLVVSDLGLPDITKT
jgi:PAS domain S-box-containing protein